MFIPTLQHLLLNVDYGVTNKSYRITMWHIYFQCNRVCYILYVMDLHILLNYGSGELKLILSSLIHYCSHVIKVPKSTRTAPHLELKAALYSTFMKHLYNF